MTQLSDWAADTFFCFERKTKELGTAGALGLMIALAARHPEWAAALFQGWQEGVYSTDDTAERDVRDALDVLFRRLPPLEMFQ